jgi:hypothetical protein
MTPAVHNNRRGLLSKTVFLPHNKACSHTVSAVIQKIQNRYKLYLPKALFPTQRQSIGIHQGTKVLPSCRDLIEADTHCICNSTNSNTNSHTYNRDSEHTELRFKRLANYIATVIQSEKSIPFNGTMV